VAARTVQAGVAVTFGAYLLWYAAYLAPRISPDLMGFWAEYTLDRSAGMTGAIRSALELPFSFGSSISTLPSALTLLVLSASAVTVVLSRGWASLVLLLGPIVATFGAALLGLAPFGGGRTDAFLLPAAALMIGIGADALRLQVCRIPQVRSLGGWLVPVLFGVVLISTPPARPYPDSNIRPLLRIIDEDRAPSEPVLVQYLARFGYALYTPSEIRMLPAPASMQGFAVEIDEPHVFVLSFSPDEVRQDVERAVEGSEGVWLLEAHMSWGARRERSSSRNSGRKGSRSSTGSRDRKPG
jgi:hypothetical protein